MQAELKKLSSPDIDLENYWPDDPESFHFILRAMVGPVGSDAAESFDFKVCTPKWLAENRGSHDFFFCRHRIIAFEYNVEAFESRLKHLCSRTIASTWDEIANKLARFGHWEFEDYQQELP